ncbi:MAG: AbrB/MazE/SpoVT family DNA-binding domain-containing protein [Tepidisphaeraceae bacterium]|jgi:AbrB family looped-hinge helix DNA binding protein
MAPSLRATLRVTEGGRIVIPADVRARLGMEVGADLVLTVEDDHAKLMNAKSARRKARERVRRYIPAKAKLSKELMAERKAEAGRE